MTKQDELPMWKWKVQPTFSVHFEFAVAPGHVASMYGFKKEDDIVPVVKHLENNANITKLQWRMMAKRTKMSRWITETHVVRS